MTDLTSPLSQPWKRISDLYQDGQLGISIEIFPPKSADADDALLETLKTLSVYQPAFISCTYGAGGSTRNRTLDWCSRIQSELNIPATAHFTCVGSTRQELLEWLELAQQQQIPNIMALRGDAPTGQESFRTVEGGLSYANELVALIRNNYPDFGIGVAGYPEKHPECCDAPTDLQNLKRKVEAGANAVFTQLFYHNENFLCFRDKADAAGIHQPIIPGIMPITEFARIKRITALCGAVIPEELAEKLEAVQDDKQAQFEIGVEFAINQCRELIQAGVPGIHFYVLNRSQACERILDALDLNPAEQPSV